VVAQEITTSVEEIAVAEEEITTSVEEIVVVEEITRTEEEAAGVAVIAEMNLVAPWRFP
jgi:hypothetical protein